MKKIICVKCGEKRGRRECIRHGNKRICGNCCSSMQLDSSCPEDCINLGKIHRKNLENKIKDLVDMGMKRKEENPLDAISIFDKVLEMDGDNIECLVEKGDLYEMLGQHDKAISTMESVLSSRGAEEKYRNKARITLAWTYLALKYMDKALETTRNIGMGYEDEKNNLLENIYFASGRMYELLHLIKSMDKIGYREKYMLLQCSLVLNKNSQGSIVAIIDDLLCSKECSNLYERMRLTGLKIKLLFKSMKIKEAYEIFVDKQDDLIRMSQDIYDCYEACNLIAFFLYNVDKNRSIYIYKSITGINLDEFLIDELYNAFITMNISPFIMSKAIERSVELMKSGKRNEFNRTLIVADILYEHGEYSGACEMYHRVVDLTSGSPDGVIMYKMGVCLVKQSKYEEALETFINVMTLTRFIPGVYLGIIRCCLETNRDWTEFFKCLELEKLSFSEIYELAMGLMAKEYYDKAGYLYCYMMEKYNNMDVYSKKMIYHNLACVYRNLKDYSKGIDLIRQIPQEYFGEDLMIDLGCLLFDTGQIKESKKVFEEAASCSKNPIISFNIGILCMKLKDYGASLKYLNVSLENLMGELADKRSYASRVYSKLIVMLYRNISLCQIKLGREKEALNSIEKAASIEKDQKVSEILSIIQQKLLDIDRGKESDEAIDFLMDTCITLSGTFTDDIRRMLDGIIFSIYGRPKSKVKIESRLIDSITIFINNEKRVYTKYKDSIERSEGTFQRYVDNLLTSFDKKVVSEAWEEAAATLISEAQNIDVSGTSESLVVLGDELFNNFEYTLPEEYMYASLIPYYKVIKDLIRRKIAPYYLKNISNLPIPHRVEEYRDIGIYSYKAGGEMCYRIDFSFNISCSEYLFDINCHPGLRSKYLNCDKHFMPWNKLLWILSGMKKKWDVVDDSKSAGLLLLFYCAYKNWLGIEGDFNNTDEIIKLSGDLIHLNNERDYCIRNMLGENSEFDYLNYVKGVREISLRCIEGLCKIKDIH